MVNLRIVSKVLALRKVYASRFTVSVWQGRCNGSARALVAL
jgi:hypothetical protein